MPESGMPIVDTAVEIAKAYDTLQYLMGMVEVDAMERRQTQTSAGSIPVSIVGGFLGAGKTTLLRRLLIAPHNMHITAIVNDFADLNIDAELIADVADDAIALTNGCVCCSQSGGIARVLTKLTADTRVPELVLLETSGVADVWAVAQTVESLPGFRIDCVTTVVDAAAVAYSGKVDYLLQRQTVAADLLLLNKMDLVSPATAAEAETRLEQLAPRAQILRTIDCAVPHDVILSPRYHASGELGRSIVDDSHFSALRLVIDGPIDRPVIERCLSALPSGVLRIKGFLRLSDSPNCLQALQVVGRRWRLNPVENEVSSEGQLVVIGLVGAMEKNLVQAHFAPAGFQVLSL